MALPIRRADFCGDPPSLRQNRLSRRIKELGDMVLDITDEAAGLRKQLELREQESRSLRDQLTKSRR